MCSYKRHQNSRGFVGEQSLVGERVNPLELGDIFNEIDKKTKNMPQFEKTIHALTEFQKTYYEQLGSLVAILSSMDVVALKNDKNIETTNIQAKIYKN